MKKSSPKNLSADCRSTVGRQSADSWLSVGRQSVVSFIKLEIGNSNSSQTCKIEDDVSNSNAQGKHY